MASALAQPSASWPGHVTCRHLEPKSGPILALAMSSLSTSHTLAILRGGAGQWRRFAMAVMFLAPCPACGHSVSSYAAACPACGHVLQAQPAPREGLFLQTMNGFTAIVLLGLAGLLFWVLLFGVIAAAALIQSAIAHR